MILVTGASGAIGARLTSRLEAEGANPVAAGRRPEELARRWPGLRVVQIDVRQPETLTPALEQITTAYYLVHSMEPGVERFEETDHAAAAHFAPAAKRAGVERVVYLGGLGANDTGAMSPHLASRQEVGRILASEGPTVLEFRAAMVVSAESASFRMLQDLVNRLPAMVVPRWVDTRSQPIAIDDVIDYLVAGASVSLERHHTVVEIGGPEIDHLSRDAAGLRRLAGHQSTHHRCPSPHSSALLVVVRPHDVGPDGTRPAADRGYEHRGDRARSFGDRAIPRHRSYRFRRGDGASPARVSPPHLTPAAAGHACIGSIR